jgi:hypothetical protein
MKLIDKLDAIIKPHYLGVDRVESKGKTIEKSVIFNHRANGYTGWNWFVDAMDRLWEKRQDFTVYTTYAKIDRPWNKQINEPTREGYIEFLKRMKFGVSCFEGYSAWSISTTDGLSVNVPYLLPNKLCYPEMVPTDYPYLYTGRDEFIEKFEEMLDNELTYDTTKIANKMLWGNRISEWFGGWNNVSKPCKNPKLWKTYLTLYEERSIFQNMTCLENLGGVSKLNGARIVILSEHTLTLN